MLEKSKEIQRLRNLENKKLSSRGSGDNFSGGFGSSSSQSSGGFSSSMNRGGSGSGNIIPAFEPKTESFQSPAYSTTAGKPNRAMKLGNKDALPAFVEQAKQLVNTTNSNSTSSSSQVNSSAQNIERYVRNK